MGKIEIKKIDNQSIIYGPVNSRRLGKSLGINLMPSKYKLCPFDCIYCHCGCTQIKSLNIKDFICDIPTIKGVTIELEKKIQDLVKNNVIPDFITFSGSGEASLHSDFSEIIKNVKKLRDKYINNTLVAILSSSTVLNNPEKINDFALLDRIFMKLDAGNERIFNLVNRPATGISFNDIVNGLKKLRNCCNFIIQTNFFNGTVCNCDKKSLYDWMGAVSDIKPDKILIYTVCRYTPEVDVKNIPDDEIDKIAQLVTRETGIPTFAFYSSDRNKNIANRNLIKW